MAQALNFETVEAAFAVNELGCIVHWNPAAEKAFGYPASMALGQRCWELLAGKDTDDNKHCCRFCPIREMAFHHEPVHEFKAIFKTGSAEWQQFAVSCLTIFDEPGNEQLLHICRPENEISEKEIPPDSETLSTTEPSRNDLNSSLSQREIEVLKLLAIGETTRKIASLLGIKTSTVRIHIQHVLLKLKVHKRREAVKMGRQLDLI